ncbi:uncharacterized protein LOC103008269 isoform X3 [Balaenoptera acutorostrata]|uniref:Uncharacterized protein LOC103008269 isoform X3 n=2 Tax=Balaenoptera acutorostrata TaxID=9767 RepID=A0ABM3TJJ4_BALAC|nr:uncharacterized protein LOC103008269 isoform X3 [Balaenoptera acutorostrata]
MADFLASDLASEPPGLQGGHHRAWRRLKFTATEVPAREGLQSYDGDLHLGFLGAHTACPSVLDLVASQARSPHHCHLQVLFTGWLEWLLLAHVDPWMPHEVSHLCPGQNVPGQLHFTEGAFTNGAEDLEVINMSLLASRFGCEALHPGDLLTTLTDSTT